MKNTFAVALFFSSMLSCETNRLLSAFGKWFKKMSPRLFLGDCRFFSQTQDLSTNSPSYLDTVLFVKYKMVVLTVVTQENGATIYFQDPLPKVHFMKLLSCSFFNSWDTLKREFSATLGDKDKDRSLSISKMFPGYYSLERMAKEIEGLFTKYNYNELQTLINRPVGQLVIRNLGQKPIELDPDLAALLGIGRKLMPLTVTFVKRN